MYSRARPASRPGIGIALRVVLLTILMSRTRTIGVFVVVLGMQLLAVTSLADDPSDARRDDLERWVPGFSFFSMGLVGERSATTSNEVLGMQQGDSVGFPWSVGGSLELASPVVADLPGRPRLYIHGDAAYAFDIEDPVVSTGDPGEPPDFLSSNDANQVVQAIENVGSAARVEAEPLVLSGGVGAVFEFERWERTFRIRPSLEWIYRRDSLKTVLGLAEVVSSDDPDNPSKCDPCRTLFLEAQTEKGYHSLGPGLEIEAEAGRFRDFLLSVYASGRAYRILGDRTAEIAPAGKWVRDDGLPTSRADTVNRVRYEREPWHYRFGVGLRFLWWPE